MQDNKGFTLLECMVTVIIIGILVQVQLTLMVRAYKVNAMLTKTINTAHNTFDGILKEKCAQLVPEGDSGNFKVSLIPGGCK
jgi:prepilin-type N-terminal cleavage/methylation domain-containing protein